MAELALFRPAEALDAETRLAEFIRHARDDLTVFGAGLDWHASTWELRGVARVSGRGNAAIRVNWGHPLKKAPTSKASYTPLDARNVDFFKAYLRYRYGLSPLMNPHQMLTAIRRLDKALSGAGKSIPDARPDDFNAAAAACRSDYSPESSYRVGQQLEAIAGLLDDHGLVARPLVWTSPIRRPTHFNHIGAERERMPGRKPPSERALAALGEGVPPRRASNGRDCRFRVRPSPGDAQPHLRAASARRLRLRSGDRPRTARSATACAGIRRRAASPRRAGSRARSCRWQEMP